MRRIENLFCTEDIDRQLDTWLSYAEKNARNELFDCDENADSAEEAIYNLSFC